MIDSGGGGRSSISERVHFPENMANTDHEPVMGIWVLAGFKGKRPGQG